LDLPRLAREPAWPQPIRAAQESPQDEMPYPALLGPVVPPKFDSSAIWLLAPESEERAALRLPACCQPPESRWISGEPLAADLRELAHRKLPERA